MENSRPAGLRALSGLKMPVTADGGNWSQAPALLWELARG